MRYVVAVLILLAAALAIAISTSDPRECLTDTECMQMHGGSGGPE